MLETDARNVKALYRRGDAYAELQCLELAIKDLCLAASFSKDSSFTIKIEVALSKSHASSS